MKRLEEIQSFAAYLGDGIEPHGLECLFHRSEETEEAYSGCVKYVLSGGLFSEDPQLAEQLRVLPALMTYWKRQSIELTICIFLREGRLVGGQIHKKKNTVGGFQYEMTPTLQEIRLVRRILEMLTGRRKQ